KTHLFFYFDTFMPYVSFITDFLLDNFFFLLLCLGFDTNIGPWLVVFGWFVNGGRFCMGGFWLHQFAVWFCVVAV
ncbi:hypothetical protein, partial [Enterobacter roggenkampii]|uniref:hypothetical protein n=1 Tax=Enterobacter roggenkampii TaxID=1812935 RepID=UPI00197ACE76